MFTAKTLQQGLEELTTIVANPYHWV